MPGRGKADVAVVRTEPCCCIGWGVGASQAGVLVPCPEGTHLGVSALFDLVAAQSTGTRRCRRETARVLSISEVLSAVNVDLR